MEHRHAVELAPKKSTKSPEKRANEFKGKSNKNPRAAQKSQLTDDLLGCLFTANSQQLAPLVWELFSVSEKRRLNGSLERAYKSFDNLTDMWANVRGGTNPRAAIDILAALEVIGPKRRRALLQQLGEEGEDAEATMELAIQSGCLVLADAPRRAYWKTKQIKIDWDAKTKLWEYFLAVCEASRGSVQVDAFTTAGGTRRHTLRKSRLLKTKGFPRSLATQFGTRGSANKLSLLPAEIRIFQRMVQEELVEWEVGRTGVT